MESQGSESGYKVWAVDDVVYGPVDLPTLIDWISDERVLADTWLFVLAEGAWRKAGELDELKLFFGQVPASAGAAAGAKAEPLIPGIKPGTLRRVKIFAAMNDQQLGRFVQLMQIEKAASFKEVCHQGSPGDAMYCVLDGEVRARILVGGRETTLATFQAGDVFGEICLFDDGPRSADVIANVDSTLLKIPSDKFDRLCQEQPDLATPFLLSLGRTLTARIRNDNKRLGELITLSRAGQ
jgi:hypothetical protein